VPDSLPKRIDQLTGGDHACLVCETDSERWDAVARFLRRGLEQGERTVYVTAEHGEDELRAQLDLGEAGDGLLIVPAPIAQGYADGGGFDYVERLAAWRQQALAAVDEGFAGIRVAVDMAWLHDVDLSLDDLVDYERRGAELFDGLPGTALCVYDRRRFDDHLLARACYAHRISLGEALAPAPVYESRLLQVQSTGPGAIRLAGEIDPSNVAALADVLCSARSGDGLVLDMRSVDFIDVAGLRAIHGLAESGCGALVLVSPKPVVRRMLSVLGIDATVTVDDAA
jgi:anti-anti-sigma factor